jgi:alcohol dehydrogenase
MKIEAAVIRKIGLPQPYAKSQPLAIEQVELAQPGERELLVQVKAAGLCHSDLSSINGDRPRQTPMVLGHEAAGVVMECGPGVHDLAPGDRVVMVFAPSCGECIACKEGHSSLPFDEAALFGCAVLTGVGAALNTAQVFPGARVAVVGLGGVGLNAHTVRQIVMFN